MRYQPTIDPLYGTHVAYDQGQAVKTPDIEAGLGRHALDWNASLIDPYGDSILLWVHEVESSFTLEGKTAQSRSRRQFFPHNFAKPTVTIRGIVPNNYQYNRLASFVRRSQAGALIVDNLVRNQTLPTMHPAGSPGPAPFTGRTRTTKGFSSGIQGVPTTQLAIKPGKVKPGRTHRGPHTGWLVEGFIKSITAGATRFEYAKEFEFEFIITTSAKTGTTGLYSDSAVNGSQIAPWMDLFKKSGFQGIGPHSVDRAINAITRDAEEVAAQLGDLFS